MKLSLAPGLLIAMPKLEDPNFHRSVVLMCAHTREGAFGLVLNHSLDLPMRAICEEQKIVWTGDLSQTALAGGPCERHRGWLLHRGAQRFEGTQVIDEGLALTASRDGLLAYAADPAGSYRLMLGYSGWGPGQLDREVLEGSWLTQPLDPRVVDLVFTTPRATLWHRTLALVGIDPNHLAEVPGHIH